ncbi:hypothetical protein DJ021_16520 [Phenylobacterium hankyongense]|uniref:DUF6249 domain-containing protein n=1 Tax=Phenylobacterium hankyongense TaxID=1813876 RepID=A0A328B1H0_9CAUL|nr:DUF6249 domain-containing protein [Phenylobacterium hankyongense]RAK61292.1 hypothetical protein DJ021_16520 [Phenylobacterium hankyongense]
MEILIPITLFAMIAAIVIAPRYFKSLERQKLQDTLRAAIEKGQPLPPEVVAAMTTDVKPDRTLPSSSRDLRTGIIWLGVGIGMAALGVALSFDEPDATYPLIGIAAFPAFIGLAFIVISFLNRDRK